jgi:DNA-binding MarR family transcriptional regulator
MKLNEGTRRYILSIGKRLSRGRKTTSSDIKKEGFITLSHSTKIVKELEENKLIKRNKEGRNKYIDLTSEGWKAYHCLRILKEVGLE